MSLDDITRIGPLAYRGKVGCMSVTCPRLRTAGPDIACYGWHCAYCDAPCSYQGCGCDAAEAVLGEAWQIAEEEGRIPKGDAR